jgi:aspartate-semialdehyde dehydrogenase
MVGSVLMQRMREEGDFALIEPVFFTTSNPGGKAPAFADGAPPLKDAKDIDALRQLDRSSPSCARRAGTATGSTPHRACA